MMKKIKYLISLAALALAFASCSDKLNLGPEDYYGSANFWNNEAQVKGFIYGIHSQIRGQYQNFFLLGEARGGLQKNGTSSVGTSLDYSSPIKNNAFTASNTGVTSWAGFYGRILNVNLAIIKVEDKTATPFLSDDSRNFYLGQLYGIRAFYYFWLYRTYGGVPIVTDIKALQGVTTALPLYTERSTPKQTLDFIKTDVNKSETYFAGNTTLTDKAGVWSMYATEMLKAEIYLWSAKVTNVDQVPASSDITTAESAINQVIGKFSLQSKFSDVFSSTNKGNSEIIYTLRFLDTEATNWFGNFISADNLFIGAVYSKTGKLINTDTLNTKNTGILRHEWIWNFWKSYDKLDTRKAATFLDFYVRKADTAANGVGGLVLRKFLGEINSTNNRVYTSDIPVYRYADALLLMAEIQNKKGADPSSYINQVRQRAYGANWNASLYGYTNSTFAANELAILAERDKEFVAENTRWFDLLRMQDANGQPLVFSTAVTYGSANPVLNPATEQYKVMWPVNISTLNNDPKLKQTPGY